MLLSFILAYLIGSIPFGFLIAKKVRGIDLRRHGSFNVGATNVFRVVGKPWGIFVFLLDVAKGYLAVCLPLFSASALPEAGLYCGLLAILGHTFPVWLKFKGGKGVATSLGVFLGVVFLPTLFTFLVWGLVFLCSRIISLSSMAGAALFPVLVILLCRKMEIYDVLWPAALVLSAFIFYTHRSNIRRLLKGEEKKII